MPVYEYTALDTSGKNLSGIIDADSAVIARQKLRGSGVFPVEVKEVSVSVPGGLPSGPVSVSGLFKRVKGAEVSVTTRQLSVLLAAGVPPLDAARLGAHVHGCAGDLAVQDKTEISLKAGDLIDYLPSSFRELTDY